MKKIIVIIVIITTILGCKKFMPDNSSSIVLKANISEQDYSVQIPYVQLTDNSPNDNQLTDAGAALGRVLFYDTRLSINNNVACATCHKQENAFADGLALSTGFDGGLTSRNSMGLCNLINSSKLFWDGRTPNLEQLALEPVSHPVEMGFEKIDILPKKLALSNYYPPLFENAFGSAEITKEKIAKSIAQFLRSMASYSAPIDNTNVPNGGWSTQNLDGFTQSEKDGLTLFNISGCASCHNGPNFGGSQFQNIGLDVNYADAGQGISGGPTDGFFKTPSLRNVELTGPYMHDGRFKTLAKVLEHYSNDIQPHANLAPILTNASWGNPMDKTPIRFKFSAQDINNLEAFLNTLTDDHLTRSEKFSSPFISQ